MSGTPTSQTLPAGAAERAALWALLVGNFVIGSGVLMVTGLTNPLVDAFGVSVTTVGTMFGYGGLTLFVAAPLGAFLTNRMDRRVLLAGSLAFYGVGHLVCVFVSRFDTLLVLRVLLMLSAAIFTPQAASAVSQFIAPERRAAAVAFIFIGWSIAAAAGVPIATFLAAHLDWHSAYLFLGIAGVIATLGVWMTLPHGLRIPPLSARDWRAVLLDAAILTILAVTAVSIGGMFTVYPFVASRLRELGEGPTLITLVLGLYGLAGIVGAVFSTSIIGRIGPARALHLCLAFVLAGLMLWHFAVPSMVLLSVGIFIWGLGLGPSVGAQQARLIATAPMLASASIALNTSFLYAGQAAGSTIGGQLIARGYAPKLGLFGAGIVAVSLVLSVVLMRRRGV